MAPSKNDPLDVPEASISSQPKNIEKKEINQLPIIAWKGPVQVLESRDEMQRAVRTILTESSNSSPSILGFDTETRPSFVKGEWFPPALVQIATVDTVYLFRIAKLEGNDKLSPLIPLFESPLLFKVGVSIAHDVRELLKIQHFCPRAFQEITRMSRQLNYVPQGLRGLAALLLHGRISKAKQMTNWEKQHLTFPEITYAATDAWIGRELYTIVSRQQEEQQLPTLPEIVIQARNTNQKKKGKRPKRNQPSKHQRQQQTKSESAKGTHPSSSPPETQQRKRSKEAKITSIT